MEVTRTVTRETVWIVDYDFPADSNRRQFYRALRRYREEHKIMNGSVWSTQSVVITVDREFAEFVYKLASHVGRANLYKAETVKGNNPIDACLTGHTCDISLVNSQLAARTRGNAKEEVKGEIDRLLVPSKDKGRKETNQTSVPEQLTRLFDDFLKASLSPREILVLRALSKKGSSLLALTVEALREKVRRQPESTIEVPR